MAAFFFIPRRTFVRNFDRLLERSCLLSSTGFKNTRSIFHHGKACVPKKELTKIMNGYSLAQITPGTHHLTFIRPATSQSQSSFLADLKSSPPPALFLGLSGAIPFCGLATLSFIFPEHMDLIVHAQQGYGACILSFLGAIHWGNSLVKESELKPDWGTLGYSVTPSVIAWLALLCKPGPGLVTLSLGLAFALSRDLTTPCFPAWYYALRKALSTLAVSSICLTAISWYLH